ncbi:MAG: prolyl oligopeptidase family serine peptidase [Burkholderiales bacterium]
MIPSRHGALQTLTALSMAFALGAAQATETIVRPPPSLLISGAPPIDRALEQRVAGYIAFRGQRLMNWHPERDELLILQRAQRSSQIFRLTAPGRAPALLAELAEPVGWAMHPPRVADYIVLSLDQGGDERYRLHRMDLASLALTPLTDPAMRIGSAIWASKGESKDRGERLIYTAIATGQRAESSTLSTEVRSIDPAHRDSDQLIAQLPGIGWSVQSIAPDKKSLVIGEYRGAVESYLWTLDIASGTKKILTPSRDAQVAAYGSAEYLPTGRRILALTNRGAELTRLVGIDPATRDESVLAEHPWSIDGLALSDDGRRLAYRTNEDGTSVLHLLDLESGKPIAVPALPRGIISRLVWRRDTLAINISSARDPLAVYALDVERGLLTRWSAAKLGAIDTDTFVVPDLVRWKSFDGLGISGYLYLPPARFTGKRPVKMILHGGPESQSRPGFIGRLNYWVNEEGVALLFPNVRGSSGYGKTFLTLDDGRKREDSVKDAAAALDFIAQHPRLDGDRVLVSGASYGGYLSLALATLYSERIACAIDEVGIANFVSFLERTESYRRDLRRIEYGDERDASMRAFLESISPLGRAERIRKPLLVIHGANDPRVPLSEAESIIGAARKNGASVWSVIAKDEGHGFAKDVNANYRFMVAVAFARSCLGISDRLDNAGSK